MVITAVAARLARSDYPKLEAGDSAVSISVPVEWFNILWS